MTEFDPTKPANNDAEGERLTLLYSGLTGTCTLCYLVEKDGGVKFVRNYLSDGRMTARAMTKYDLFNTEGEKMTHIPVDWTKPLRTKKDRRKAFLIPYKLKDVKYKRAVAVAGLANSNDLTFHAYTNDGRFHAEIVLPSGLDLENVPEKIVRFCNFYESQDEPSFHYPSREEAVESADTDNAIAVAVRVEFTRGQGLEVNAPEEEVNEGYEWPDYLGEKVYCIAMDKDGSWWAYDNCPVCAVNHWLEATDSIGLSNPMIKVPLPTGFDETNWQESKHVNPNWKGE